MSDDPIRQAIADLRADWRDDLQDLRADISKRVSSDVYDLKHEALTKRVEAMELARERDAERLRSTIRWVVGVVIIPIVIGIIQIWTALRGPS